MTLNEVKVLLSENQIPFELCEFENEAAYWQHISQFPYTQNAKVCKVIALIISSNNHHKNIELQFNALNDEFILDELYFGDYGFEMFDYTEEMLANDLVNNINKIRSGYLVVITAINLNNKRRLGDALFYLSGDDDAFGEEGYKKALRQIHKPKGLLARLFKSKIQYEIYDWDSYQCIIK